MSENTGKYEGMMTGWGNKVSHIPNVSGQEYYTIPLRVDKETYDAIKSGRMSAISIRGINSEIKPANTVKEHDPIEERESFENIVKWLNNKNYQSYGHSFDTHEIASMIEDYIKEKLKV